MAEGRLKMVKSKGTTTMASTMIGFRCWEELLPVMSVREYKEKSMLVFLCVECVEKIFGTPKVEETTLGILTSKDCEGCGKVLRVEEVHQVSRGPMVEQELKKLKKP